MLVLISLYALDYRKKPASSSEAGSESKKRKLSKVKDPNMPKRPMTAYFVFMYTL